MCHVFSPSCVFTSLNTPPPLKHLAEILLIRGYTYANIQSAPRPLSAVVMFTPSKSHEGVAGAFCWCHSQLSPRSDCALLAVVARLNFTGQGSSGGKLRGWWWRWCCWGGALSSCCCLFMQLSNIRAVGSLSSAWRGPPTLPAWSLKVGAVWTIPPSPPSVLRATIYLPRNVGRVRVAHTPRHLSSLNWEEGVAVCPPSELTENVLFFFWLSLSFFLNNHVTSSPPTWNLWFIEWWAWFTNPVLLLLLSITHSMQCIIFVF